jgi:hypothetical protein
MWDTTSPTLGGGVIHDPSANCVALMKPMVALLVSADIGRTAGSARATTGACR